MANFLSPDAFLFKLGPFPEIQLVCDLPTDQRTDRRMDGRTDIPSYRDARTHLTSENKMLYRAGMTDSKRTKGDQK